MSNVAYGDSIAVHPKGRGMSVLARLAGLWRTSVSADRSGSSRSASRPHVATPVSAGQFSLVDETVVKGLDIVVCGDFDLAAWSNLSSLMTKARRAIHCGGYSGIPFEVNGEDGGRKLLILQIDGLRDPAAWLLEFRSRFPHVAIILVSRHFARNEFTSERRTIGDACITDPGKRVALAMALSAALVNHDEYLARRIY